MNTKNYECLGTDHFPSEQPPPQQPTTPRYRSYARCLNSSYHCCTQRRTSNELGTSSAAVLIPPPQQPAEAVVKKSALRPDSALLVPNIPNGKFNTFVWCSCRPSRKWHICNSCFHGSSSSASSCTKCRSRRKWHIYHFCLYGPLSPQPPNKNHLHRQATSMVESATPSSAAPGKIGTEVEVPEQSTAAPLLVNGSVGVMDPNHYLRSY